MKTEWRPDDWENPVQMEDFDDVGVCEGHKELYEAGASAMLAARDKEWVEWIKKAGYVRIVSRGLPSEYIYIPVEAFEERRKEIGVMSNITVNSGLYSHDIRAEIIAARDKWWVDKIDAMFITTLSSGKEVTQHYIVITHTEWQRLKKESESNNG